MVVTRSGENTTGANGLCAALQSRRLSDEAKQRLVRKMDGLDREGEMPMEVEQVVEQGADVEELDEELKEENDIDPETARNTVANESMTPKRMLRRRASSKLSPSGSDLSSSSPEGSPPKHVNFIDESQPTRVLAGHKAALHNPRTSDMRKEQARELLSFHGEACE